MSKETSLILARWIVGLMLITKGALMLCKAAEGGGGGFAGAAAYGLFAFVLVITGILLITREFVPWASAPIWRFITGLVFPDDKFDRPPVNYTLPRGYRERRRPEDAIEEYLKIIRHHPQELPAYLECMEVMIETGDLHGAQKVRATGLKKLRSAEARSEVAGKLDSLLESAGPAEGEIVPPTTD